MKTIEIKQLGFIIKGTADVSLWGGDNASLEMKPIKLETIPDDIQELKSKLNDNGFGVESINGAIINIYEQYEHGVEIFMESPDLLIIGNVSDNTIDSFYSM